MGVVYRARQRSLGREVALKVLSGPGLSPQARVRFEREARAASRLHHPAIVSIHEFRLGSDLSYYSMDLIEGRSLAEALGARKRPLEPEKAAALVAELAEATHYAHRNGIVHRDLKPANVLIGKDGWPQIADFGLARSRDEAGLTASGDVLGTPAYMSPEQARGEEVGPATDVYALGTILYECLSLETPFRGKTVADVLYKVAHEEPTGLGKLCPWLSRDLTTICGKAMRREPSGRYDTASALADDLGRFLQGEPIRARRIGAAERLWRWARKRKALAATAGMSALLICGLVAYHVASLSRQVRETRAAREDAEGKARELARALDAQRAQNLVYQAESMHREGYPIREILARLGEAESLHPDYAPIHRLRGVLAFETGDDDAALAHLRRALALDPRDPLIPYHLYRVYSQTSLRNSPEARQALQRILEIRPESAAGHYASARALSDEADACRENDPARAREIYRKALDELGLSLRADPFSSLAHELEGLVRFYLGEFDRAIASLDRAIEIEPGLVTAYYNRGLVLFARGEPARALADFERAEGMRPGPLDSKFLRARCMAMIGRVEEARSILADHLALHPEDAEGEYWLGAILEQPDPEAALRAAGRACELDPGNPRYLVNLALELGKAGRHEEAKKAIHEALSAAPRSAAARHALGYLAFLEGNLEEALSSYDEAIELDPGPFDYYNSRGVARLELGRLEEALADLDRAAELAPRDAQVRRNRGFVYQKLGRTREAAIDYDVAIELAPDSPDGYGKRGFLLSVTGDPAGARRDYDKAISIDARHAEARNNRGYLNYLERRFDQALADLDVAIESDPRRGSAWSNRGLVRLALGDPASAVLDFRKAVELAPGDSTYVFNLGLGELRAGRPEEAARAAERYLELAPEAADGWHLLGMVEEARGDRVRAAGAYRRAIELDPSRKDALEEKIRALEAG